MSATPTTSTPSPRSRLSTVTASFFNPLSNLFRFSKQTSTDLTDSGSSRKDSVSGETPDEPTEETGGGKTITFWGGIALLINNVTGGGMVLFPQAFQAAGWLVALLVLFLITVLSVICSLMIIESMALIPGNGRFQKRVEYTNIAQYYFPHWLYLVTQVAFQASSLANVISLIIQSVQVVDFMIVAVAGQSCALPQFWPEAGFNCPSPVDGQSTPFGDMYLVSLGFYIVAALVVPLGFANLDDNVIVQKGAFISVCTLLLVWTGLFINQGLDGSYVPAIGGDQSTIVGTVIFNYAIIVSIPSWMNEKRPEVSVTKSFAVSMPMAAAMFALIGWVGGLAFAPDSYTASETVLDQVYNIGSKLAVISFYAWPIIVNLSSIPVFCIMCRYNLIEGGVCGRRMANFIGVISPWLISIPLYTGSGYQYLTNWAGLVLNSAVNFIIPCILYIVAVRRAEREGIIIVKKQMVTEEMTEEEMDEEEKRMKEQQLKEGQNSIAELRPIEEPKEGGELILSPPKLIPPIALPAPPRPDFFKFRSVPTKDGKESKEEDPSPARAGTSYEHLNPTNFNMSTRTSTSPSLNVSPNDAVETMLPGSTQDVIDEHKGAPEYAKLPSLPTTTTDTMTDTGREQRDPSPTEQLESGQRSGHSVGFIKQETSSRPPPPRPLIRAVSVRGIPLKTFVRMTSVHQSAQVAPRYLKKVVRRVAKEIPEGVDPLLAAAYRREHRKVPKVREPDPAESWEKSPFNPFKWPTPSPSASTSSRYMEYTYFILTVPWRVLFFFTIFDVRRLPPPPDPPPPPERQGFYMHHNIMPTHRKRTDTDSDSDSDSETPKKVKETPLSVTLSHLFLTAYSYLACTAWIAALTWLIVWMAEHVAEVIQLHSFIMGFVVVTLGVNIPLIVHKIQSTISFSEKNPSNKFSFLDINTALLLNFQVDVVNLSLSLGVGYLVSGIIGGQFTITTGDNLSLILLSMFVVSMMTLVLWRYTRWRVKDYTKWALPVLAAIYLLVILLFEYVPDLQSSESPVC